MCIYIYYTLIKEHWYIDNADNSTYAPMLTNTRFSHLNCAGGTPLGMYKKLIEFHKAGKLSFKYVKTFNMDEYVDLPRDHPESYHHYMHHNFFKHIDINPQNVHILDGNAPNLEKECNDFEKKIKEAGGIELFIGGIAINK